MTILSEACMAQAAIFKPRAKAAPDPNS